MKKAISYIGIFLIGLTTLSAQRIYFCDNYTAGGEPVGTNSKVSCPAEGGYIYILYQNGVNNLTTGNYLIHVEKLSGDNYIPFDVKSVAADPLKTWFVYDYKFLTAGDYKITVKTPSVIAMATDYLTLIAAESSSGSSATNNFDDPSSTFYYTYSSIEATTSINASTGLTAGAYTSFNIDPSLGGRIYFKVSNSGKAIGTDKLSVYVDKKDASGTSHVFDTKIYDLSNKNSSWGQFYYDFYSNGEYIITVYSGAMTFINTITITLNYKS
jgi:hypothetical protein